MFTTPSLRTPAWRHRSDHRIVRLSTSIAELTQPGIDDLRDRILEIRNIAGDQGEISRHRCGGDEVYTYLIRSRFRGFAGHDSPFPRSLLT
jgi:hypothetical protein